MEQIIQIFSFLCVCLAITNAQVVQRSAQLRTEKIGPDAELVTGNAASWWKMGVVDVEEEYREEFKMCEKDLYAKLHWDTDFIPFSHPAVQAFYHRPGVRDNMNSAMRIDQERRDKYNNYTSYVQLDTDYRGPFNDPNSDWKDCVDMCPTAMDVAGMVLKKTPLADGTYHKEYCAIINPLEQNLQYRKCQTTEAQNVLSDFEKKHVYKFRNRMVCVPDSFIQKSAIVFCFKRTARQCDEVELRLPLSCSPKIAKCKWRRIKDQQEAAMRRNKAKGKGRARYRFKGRFSRKKLSG